MECGSERERLSSPGWDVFEHLAAFGVSSSSTLCFFRFLRLELGAGGAAGGCVDTGKLLAGSPFSSSQSWERRAAIEKSCKCCKVNSREGEMIIIVI